ncbi:outer membrane beta-barrel protein [Chitinophaga sp. CCNWLY40]
MKQLTISLLAILLALEALAQTSNRVNINGQIIDAATRQPLQGATINCLLAKDSTQKILTFSNKNGLFLLDSLPTDNYFLNITFLGYQSLVYPIRVPPGNIIINLGSIEIKSTGLTLAEVEVIQTKVPIRFTKDTIEFNASFFKTKVNAVVEDLLKKIPGIQIDNDGTIRANGKIIQNIMIDGRQLFSGGSPNTISKNLQADLIDKVQLIESTHDQEKKHGINDNQAENIINITIKKSKYNLLSGELTTSYGTSDRFVNKINLSRFNKNQQLMLLGDGNNVNGVFDTKNLGSRGIQRNYNGGGSYSNEISEKVIIGINYLVSNNKGIERRSSIRNTIINDSSLLYNQQTNNQTTNSSHDGSFQIDYKIDSLQSITASQQISFTQAGNQFSNNYESSGEHSRKINTGEINNRDKTQSLNMSSSLRYDKKFKKKNRLLSITIAYSKGSGGDNGVNMSNNMYFPSNSEIVSDTVNQNAVRNIDNQHFFSMINYTEPITTNGSLELSFVEDYAYNTSNIGIFNFNKASGSYDIPNDSLSNRFKNTPTQHYAKLSWIHQKEKFDYSISLASLLFIMKNSDVTLNNYYTTQSNTLLPEASLSYLLDGNKRLRFSYRKNQDFPQISQLQPIRDNTNPLHSKIGNQSLNPTRTHNIDLSYNVFNISSLRSFSLSFNGRILRDQIINASWYDSFGRETEQPINMNGSYIFNISIDNVIPLKQRQNSLNFNTRGIISRSMNYTNGTKTFHKDFSLNQSIGFHYEYKELFKYTFSSSLNYNKVSYSSEQISSFRYFNGSIFFTGDINLPYGITISTNINYLWATGRMEGYNSNPFMLHASISKSLFSHQQASIKLQGFDLLRQNINTTRIIQDNYIEDIKTNSLQRFFIIGFSFFLGKR